MVSEVIMGKKKENAKSVRLQARMTVEHSAKFKKLGGMKWLRDALEATDARTDREVLKGAMDRLVSEDHERREAENEARERAAWFAENGLTETED
jgi:hypothetical protein